LKRLYQKNIKNKIQIIFIHTLHFLNLRSFQTGSSSATIAHTAARDGDIGNLKEIVEIMDDKYSYQYVNKRDEHGWIPLQEAAQIGHKEVI
jgi:ankyrin repeat protein